MRHANLIGTKLVYPSIRGRTTRKAKVLEESYRLTPAPPLPPKKDAPTNFELAPLRGRSAKKRIPLLATSFNYSRGAGAREVLWKISSYFCIWVGMQCCRASPFKTFLEGAIE